MCHGRISECCALTQFSPQTLRFLSHRFFYSAVIFRNMSVTQQNCQYCHLIVQSYQMTESGAPNTVDLPETLLPPLEMFNILVLSLPLWPLLLCLLHSFPLLIIICSVAVMFSSHLALKFLPQRCRHSFISAATLVQKTSDFPALEPSFPTVSSCCYGSSKDCPVHCQLLCSAGAELHFRDELTP